MSDTTAIEWATATWNPWEPGKPRRRTSAANWKKPLKWNRLPWVCPRGHIPLRGAPGGHGPYSADAIGLPEPCCECGSMLHRCRVFCASISDWLDDEVPIEWLADFLRLIHDTPNLDWLLLTKRPENFKPLLEAVWTHSASEAASGIAYDWLRGNLVPANIWLGTSVENQQTADERIPKLLTIPAKARFLSVEPLLEAVDLTKVPRPDDAYFTWRGETGCIGPKSEPDDYVYWQKKLIQWVIVGGESGPGARPCDVNWIRGVVSQCQSAGVPCFVKQLGSNCWADEDECHCFMADEGKDDIRWRAYFKHPKGGDPAEWSADLQVRQFPKP